MISHLLAVQLEEIDLPYPEFPTFSVLKIDTFTIYHVAFRGSTDIY